LRSRAAIISLRAARSFSSYTVASASAAEIALRAFSTAPGGARAPLGQGLIERLAD
jgi:hypothetical protein